jgi:glycosyl hydrolase family 42 (putative beta-galactosidase)
MHRSFAKPNSMIGFWTGYGSHGLAVQNAIWTAAIHDVLHPNIFWMYSFLNPDLTYSASARDMGRAFSSLKFEGVGKLLMESERRQDGIALYYSMPSIHAATILGYHQRSSDDDDAPDKAHLSFAANRDGWVKTIKDLGLQFDFISSEDVAKNPIPIEKYKVLILPLAFALSNEEIEHIRDFVSRGGVVIADSSPGLMDQHCAWRSTDEVNQLFGVRVAEPDLKPSTVAPIVHNLGKGWTVYLNTVWDQYPRQRANNFGGAVYRELARAALDKAGVRPVIEVLSPDGHPVSQAQIVRYQFGDSEVLAIVKENVGTVGQDGVTTYNDAKLGPVAKQDLLIKLPQKRFVTDIRTGKQFGYTDVVRTSILIGDAIVLALSPLEKKITIESVSSATRGDHVRLNLASTSSNGNLIRCHVFGPDGTMLAMYSSNVLLEQGRGNFVLPFALNDAPGRYLVRATDVTSGATVEKTIELTQSRKDAKKNP